MEQRPVCLTIGGSDSCAGAGIQADLRIFSERGVRACSAITALTAQNPKTVSRIEPTPLAQLDAEIHAVFDYYPIAAVKTGMLVDAEHIAVMAAALSERHDGGILIVDPVMLSSSGSVLLDGGGRSTLQKALIPMATLLTPNLDEASVLLGREVDHSDSACAELSRLFDCAVLLKGGHGKGDELCDVLCEAGGQLSHFRHPRLAWDEDRLHGTGCRLAASIACEMAVGKPLGEAVENAIGMCSPQA